MSQRTYCNHIVELEVSQELGLPLSTVKKIVAAQSGYTKEIIESGTFDSVRWPYLGRFSAKHKMVQMINHIKGMSAEQAIQFKKDVKAGRIKFNWWEKKK